MEKLFTTDWLTGNIPTWQSLLSHLFNKENIKVLEIGSFEGRTSCWILDNLITEKGSSLTCIDTWQGSMEHSEYHKNNIWETFKNNTKNYSIDKLIVKRGKSSDILRSDNLDQYDFIYIDGSHVAKDVLEDAVLSFYWLKPDGVMIFDDYPWNPYPNPLLCPKMGIDCFVSCYSNELKIIHAGYQVAIKKLNKQ